MLSFVRVFYPPLPLCCRVESLGCSHARECQQVTVSTVLTRVTANRELSQLRNSAAVFLRHYVKGFTLGIGDGGHKGATGDKAALLAQRIKLAKRCLARSDHDLG